jgi:hypothetical protein
VRVRLVLFFLPFFPGPFSQLPLSSYSRVGALSTETDGQYWAAANVSVEGEEMLNRKLLHMLFGVVILGVLSTVSTGAIWNAKRTSYFTFDRAVQIPGVSLPAGVAIAPPRAVRTDL